MKKTFFYCFDVVELLYTVQCTGILRKAFGISDHKLRWKEKIDMASRLSTHTTAVGVATDGTDGFLTIWYQYFTEREWETARRIRALFNQPDGLRAMGA